MPKKLAIREEGVDVDLKNDKEGAVAELLANALFTKAFCVVEPHLEESLLEKALSEVDALKEQQRFFTPPALVAEGLLGLEGSSTIAELASPDETARDGESLGRLDSLMTDTAQELGPFFDSIGFEFSHRTRSVLHEAGIVPVSPELTEKDVTKWLEKFLRHKVMAVVFMGPIVGTLKLQLHDDPDNNFYEIPMPPGRMVLLRPDILAHEYVSLGTSTAISMFFITGQAYKKNHSTGGFVVCPVAKAIDQWAMDRVAELRAQESQGAVHDADMPREFQRAMDLFFLKDRDVQAVRGIAGRIPTTWDMDGFFNAVQTGTDMCIRVPLSRWDHDMYYSDVREDWKHGKINCQHGAFMDGPEMFDNKQFSISLVEARSMDPNQRLILECAYGAFYQMGCRKKDLMNAHSGVFIGYTMGEYSNVPQDQAVNGPTGGAGCVAAGRVSFVLGMKGPSFTIDSECTSSMNALYLCAEANQKKGDGVRAVHGVAVGATMMLSPIWWVGPIGLGWITSKHRCLTFDVSASGYVRSEGHLAVTMKSLNEVVDGEIIEDETPGVLGILAGCSISHNGKAASLKAPSAVGEQEIIWTVCRNAGVSPEVIDASETHGAGAYLSDVVEVSSLQRVCRPDSDTGQPLSIMGAKTNMGNLMESCGMIGFVKVLKGHLWGLQAPNIHLRELNPHMDSENLDINFQTELVQYPRVGSYSGVMSLGCSGTNGYGLAYGTLSPDMVPNSPDFPAQHEMITFWPGGGGELEEKAVPVRGYFIVGSWSQWADPEPMAEVSRDVFSCTVTLGENCWEQFQIWIDGDAEKVLHPGWSKASKETAVEGPDEDAGDCSWMIDGRSDWWQEQDSALTYPTEVAYLDAGRPGDKYRVSLRIVGKWRMVDWEKVEEVEEGEELPPGSTGKYYVVGSFNDWTFAEMSHDHARAGVQELQVTLRERGAMFNIARNRDLGQIFYPDDGGWEGGGDVLGPDAPDFDAPSWYIDGRPGETYLIEFTRVLESGRDEKKISWKKV